MTGVAQLVDRRARQRRLEIVNRCAAFLARHPLLSNWELARLIGVTEREIAEARNASGDPWPV